MEEILADNDYLTILLRPDGSIEIEPRYALVLWLESDEFEYPDFDDIFEGLGGTRAQWTYGRRLGGLVIWDERYPGKSWVWVDQDANDIRAEWQRFKNTVLTRF